MPHASPDSNPRSAARFLTLASALALLGSAALGACSAETVAEAPAPADEVSAEPSASVAATSADADPSASASAPRFSVSGDPNADPHIARQAALRDAAEFGMMGLLRSGAGGDPDAPTAPWGRDDSLVDDKMSARGNMWGDQIGEQFGTGGLGLRGTGIGGGGRGEGMGIGGLGTRGTGGGGTAQGLGGLGKRGKGAGGASSAGPGRAAEPMGPMPTVAGKPLTEVTALEIERALRDAGYTDLSSSVGPDGKGVVFSFKKGTSTFKLTFSAASAGADALPVQERKRLGSAGAAVYTAGAFFLAVESDDKAASQAVLSDLVKKP